MTELQADRASDRRIAERLGLEVFEMWSFAGKEEPGVILDPDKGIESCPRYTTSLDTAIELINPDIVIEFRRIFSNLWQVFIPHELDPEENYVGLASGNPALAVCRAWWEWMDSREEA